MFLLFTGVAVQRHNEEKLNAAFRAGSTVLLVFSVNGSGHFQGFAKMVTLVNRQRVRRPPLSLADIDLQAACAEL